jgi:hypothetical protein
MFCADANATPANSAAVLIRSLLLIGTVLWFVPARRLIRRMGNKRRQVQFRGETYLARRIARHSINAHSLLRQQKVALAWTPKFRGTAASPPSSSLRPTTE